MKAKGYRTSISPAKKTMDVRPWLCGRTFKGCLHVRREGLRTYVQRVPGRTSKEPLNRAERNWTICLMKYCTKDALLCGVWAASLFQIVWDGRHFSNVKMSFCLRVRVTSPFVFFETQVSSSWDPGFIGCEPRVLQGVKGGCFLFRNKVTLQSLLITQSRGPRVPSQFCHKHTRNGIRGTGTLTLPCEQRTYPSDPVVSTATPQASA